MAYKYDDFVTAANSAGMMNKFSQQDLATAQKNPEYGLSMLSLMKDYDSSETEEQRLLAEEAANQLRKTYGTYGQAQSLGGGMAVTAPTLPGGSNPNSGSFGGMAQTAPTLPGGTNPNSGSINGMSRTAPTLPGVTKPDSQTGSISQSAPVIPGVAKPDSRVGTLEGTTQTAPTLPGVVNPDNQTGSASQSAPVIPGVTKPDSQVGTLEGTTQTAPTLPGVVNPDSQTGTVEGDTQTAPTLPGVTDPGAQTQQQSGYNGTYADEIAAALGLLGNYGEFSYGNEEAYQQLLQKILNPEAFSYDPETDQRFGSYKKTYLREGDRATANALAKASAATGGVPSSYAAMAAAQAGNYYAGKVADVIPQLYEDAYNQYINEQQQLLTGLGALQDDKNFAYQEYLDQYDMAQRNLDNLQEQDQTEYDRYKDKWSMDRTEEQDAYDKALAQYEMLGYATPEIAQILGINADLSEKEILALQKAMNAMGANIYMDGKLGNQTWQAFQNLGYMDAWPAYQAMMEAGLIDNQGNYIGPEIKRSYGGVRRDDGVDTSYQGILDRIMDMKNNGESITSVYDEIDAARNDGYISPTQYDWIMSDYVRR